VGGGNIVREDEVEEGAAGDIKDEAATCSEVGDEAVTSSKARDEAMSCSGTGIEDGKQWRHSGV
jgi:hypothetical protein